MKRSLFRSPTTTLSIMLAGIITFFIAWIMNCFTEAPWAKKIQSIIFFVLVFTFYFIFKH